MSDVPSNYFPDLTPSQRSITYGDWTIDRFGSGRYETTLPLPCEAIKANVLMELVYANRAHSVARAFLQHYNNNAGDYYDFPLQSANKKSGTFAGYTAANHINLTKGRWVYVAPPEIITTHPERSTTTIRVRCLDPELTQQSGSSGPSPGDPQPPTDEPPYGFIPNPDGQGGFIPNPEQTGAFLRLLRWTNRTQPAYVTTYASCTEGEIGPAETWSGTYVEGPYYMDTNYENVRNESKTWLLSEPSSWKWVDGTSGQRTIVNGQKVTSEVTAGVTTQQYGLRAPNGFAYSDPCTSRVTVEVPDSCITREGAIDGNQTDGTCDVCFLPDDWEDQMSEKYGATWKVDYTTNEQKYLMAKEFCDIDNQGRPDL